MEHLRHWWALGSAPDAQVQKREKKRVGVLGHLGFSMRTLSRLMLLFTHFSSHSLSRLTPPWPPRSATSPRCSRTAMKTQRTSSLSRCRTRPAAAAASDVGQQTPLLHHPSVFIYRLLWKATHPPILFLFFTHDHLFDSCAVTQVDAWTWINPQISNVFSLSLYLLVSPPHS